MLIGRSAELLAALRRTFPRWNCTLDGDRLTLAYGRNHTPFRPPRRPRDWATMLDTLAGACAANGIRSCPPLPLRGLDDAELTFSAVQALDPYLKHRQHHVHGHGYLPQPVVRFTGDREEHGALLPGFATSFVNTSIVEPIRTVDDHTGLLDSWISALSALGFHARHLTISGTLAVWHRPPVDGITLRIHHEGRELGDAVLLWHHDEPNRLATDIGCGLERLAWLLSGRSWADVVYAPIANKATPQVLDAVRTATLIVGSGIRPAPRGPGSAVRRLLRKHNGGLGLSSVVRWAHSYWSLTAALPVPWPEVCRVIDTETDLAMEARRCD